MLRRSAGRSVRRPRRPLRHAWRSSGRRVQGQALIEYSLITFFLLLTTGTLAFVGLPRLLEVYQEYISSFFFVLNAPFP